MNITEQEYNKEIESIAYTLIEEAMEYSRENNSDYDFEDHKECALEYINESSLHQTVDSHQWIIYTAYALDVIQYSRNDEYMMDNFKAEALESALKDGGLNGLHTAIAFWCMYADIQESLDTEFDEYESNEEA